MTVVAASANLSAIANGTATDARGRHFNIRPLAAALRAACWNKPHDGAFRLTMPQSRRNGRPRKETPWHSR